jgi:tetratricopeptide (TPR) repeat protein
VSSLLDEGAGRSFVEALLRPSVVLISAAGQPSATGFFVSRSGLIATAYHVVFAKDPEGIVVSWQGRSLPARVLPRPSPALDLGLLTVAPDPLAEPFEPLPVLTGDWGEVIRHHPLAAMGYAAVGTRPLALAYLFEGRLQAADQGGEQGGQLVIADLAESKGMSGAPILDLALMRIVGLVAFRPSLQPRLGGATSLQFLAGLPGLAEEWRQAGARFDRALADFLTGRGEGLDPSELPAGALRLLAGDHNRRVRERHRRRGTFAPDAYLPRSIEPDVDLFLEQPEAAALLIAGTAGSGKTNLLLHLAEALGSRGFQTVFVPCGAIEAPDLLGGAFGLLLLPRFTPEKAAELLGRLPGTTWVLLFDALNEWRQFDRERFREFLERLAALIAAPGGAGVKLVVSVSSEFLRQKLPGFGPAGRPSGGALGGFAGLFYSPREGQRFLELTCAATAADGEAPPELESLYDHYRSLPGHRPRTLYAQLSPMVRQIISLPLLLALFTRRYHDQEVPDVTLGSALVEDFVLPILARGGEASEMTRQDAADLLAGLAGLVFERQDGGLGASYAEVKSKVSADRTLIEALVDSPLLGSHGTGDDLVIGFQSDWYFEYFLARWLWSRQGKLAAEAMREALRTLLAPRREAWLETHLVRSLTLVAERAAGGTPRSLDLAIALFNLDAAPPHAMVSADAFVRSFLDLLRLQSRGAALPVRDRQDARSMSPVDLLAAAAMRFTDAGWRRLLDYVEHLETLCDYASALGLLEHETHLWAKPTGELGARRALSLAFNRFYENDVAGALDALRDVRPELLPGELPAKRQFVLGRCLQYEGRYVEAAQEFARGSRSETTFGFRCLHQQAFIRFFVESDYAAAQADLDSLLANPHFAGSADDDQASEPRLLLASCLVHRGRYSAAEAALRRLIEVRRRLRRPHKEGTACRALADLHLRRFRRADAEAAIARAVECLESSPQGTSLAYALEVQAAILGLLAGDLGRAGEVLSRSIELSAAHRPTRSWSLQTRALLAVLAGDREAAGADLAEARSLFLNPNQELRERFVILLGDSLAAPRGALLGREIAHLRGEYEQRGYAWYPGLLNLILAALPAGRAAPGSPGAARDCFGEDVDGPGLIASYLYARIFRVA